MREAQRVAREQAAHNGSMDIGAGIQGFGQPSRLGAWLGQGTSGAPAQHQDNAVREGDTITNLPPTTWERIWFSPDVQRVINASGMGMVAGSVIHTAGSISASIRSDGYNFATGQHLNPVEQRYARVENLVNLATLPIGMGAITATRWGNNTLGRLSSNQLAALRNAGLNDAEVASHIQILGDVQLFRGTTPGFPGNPVLQQFGITPASTDPLVATVFALEGRTIGGDAVVLTGGMRRFRAGDIDLGNVRASLEREVQVNMRPNQFEALASNSIPVDTARQVLNDMGVIKLPSTITNSHQATQILEGTARLTPAQIQEFLTRTGIRH
jgi:hypothetical protein